MGDLMRKFLILFLSFALLVSACTMPGNVSDEPEAGKPGGSEEVNPPVEEPGGNEEEKPPVEEPDHENDPSENPGTDNPSVPDEPAEIPSGSLDDYVSVGNQHMGAEGLFEDVTLFISQAISNPDDSVSLELGNNGGTFIIDGFRYEAAGTVFIGTGRVSLTIGSSLSFHGSFSSFAVNGTSYRIDDYIFEVDSGEMAFTVDGTRYTLNTPGTEVPPEENPSEPDPLPSYVAAIDASYTGVEGLVADAYAISLKAEDLILEYIVSHGTYLGTGLSIANGLSADLGWDISRLYFDGFRTSINGRAFTVSGKASLDSGASGYGSYYGGPLTITAVGSVFAVDSFQIDIPSVGKGTGYVVIDGAEYAVDIDIPYGEW